MVGFIDRIRARQQRRRNPDRPVPMAAEQTANVQQLGAQAGQAGGQYQDAYGALGDAKAGFDALAAGEGPSLAQAQLEAQSGRDIASQIALAGQARGGNLAAMSDAARSTGAGMALQTNQQAAELRAQEQLGAMQAGAGLAGQMAGMSSDRQLGMMGMGQQALSSQVDRDMAWRLAQQDARERRREANRAFGLGVADRGLGAVEAAANFGGTFSDRTLKRDIKPAKSPIAILLGKPEPKGECEICGRAGCEAEHETERMGRGPSRSEARDALEQLTAYEYEYTDEGRGKGMPEGKVLGVMAQDLEKSKAGRELVDEKDGRKWIDGRKALSLVLAGAADHEERLAALEGKGR